MSNDRYGARVLHLEQIERRDVPAATATVQGGVLMIAGTDAADMVVVSTTGDQIQVTIDGVAQAPIASTDVQLIVFTGAGGNDIFVNNTDVASIALGGAGADILVGGTNTDIFLGGDGNDILVGNAGNDILVGEAGSDILSGGAGQDILAGGADTDMLIGGADKDIFFGGVQPGEFNDAAGDVDDTAANAHGKAVSEVAHTPPPNSHGKANGHHNNDQGEDN